MKTKEQLKKRITILSKASKELKKSMKTPDKTKSFVFMHLKHNTDSKIAELLWVLNKEIDAVLEC